MTLSSLSFDLGSFRRVFLVGALSCVSSIPSNFSGESLINAVVPYSFDSGISKKERQIVSNAVKKFNIDLKGCIHIV